MSATRTFVFLFLLLPVMSCIRHDMAESSFTETAEIRMKLSRQGPADSRREDTIDTMAIFAFDQSGRLEAIARGNAADNTYELPLKSGYHICVACCGDIPEKASTLDEYYRYMPSFRYNCYDSDSVGFSMAGQTAIVVDISDRVQTGNIILSRNFCKVTVEDIILGEWKNSFYGQPVSIAPDTVLLANIPSRVHINGSADDSGTDLVNLLGNSGAELCSGSMAQCTIAGVGDKLFCMPTSEGKIVFAADVTFSNNVKKRWYYSVPLQIKANNANYYSIRITGPGGDDMNVPESSAVDYDVESWEDSKDYIIDF